jgi:DNA primase/predicted transcriptional regulator
MEIADIKQSLSILKVLAHYNLVPDRNNRLKCPFHDDTTPSFQVYPKTNTWHCFSSNCKAGSGDQVDFIMKYKQISKHEAILKAQELMGIIPEKPKQEADYIKLFEGFKYALQRSPRAKEYLTSRKLMLPDIGYNSGHQYEKLKNCIVFALRNKAGQVISLYGRSILNDENARHFYTAGRQGLYPGYPKADTTKLILTEAIIDAATLLQLPEITAQYAVLSLYGTNGLTDEHRQAIKDLHQLQEVILFFDGDEAGRQAIKKHYQELSSLKPGIKVSYVETPNNEDVNSLSISHEPEIFPHLLENRIFLFQLKEENPLPAIQQTKPVLNTRNSEYITFTTDDLQIVLLGGINLQQLDRLRVTIKISRVDTPDPLHSIRHTLDLYNADYLEKFIAGASSRLETGTTVLNRAIAQLIDEIERYRLTRIESMKEQKPRRKELTDEQKRKAIAYLQAPNLMERTGEDLGKTGVIGEETSRLLMYLVFTSRLRDQPLHIISLGSSGTGKTYLQEKIAELIPEHDKLEITILSENAFYYFEQTELKHKLVLIEDMDGAENVLYPLRELQSKKRISKTIPIKDSKGNLKTITLKVEGPICLAGTTTRERLYEDNANRSILIYIDGSTEHRELVMDYQRRLSAGKIDSSRERQLKESFKNMQMVLHTISVRNPYAELLKIPEYVFKPLRTNSHYLAFIETVTFYHQYQRDVKTDPSTSERYIETTPEDIRWANFLLKDVLLAKSDELPRQVREFFEGVKYHVKVTQKESFYAKEIRQKLRLNPMTVNRYLRELETRGYIRKVGGNRKSGFEYEVLNWSEYSELQQGIKVLDEILERIKAVKNNRSITKRDVILNAPVTIAS